MQRLASWIAAMWLGAWPTAGEEIIFRSPAPDGDTLVIYSTLDARLAEPLVTAFQAHNPGARVVYEDFLSGEIAERVVAETDAGGFTADFVFSSAMDAQVKLANDGYAQRVLLPESAGWPHWANWRDMALCADL